jgi:hypothetical protein
LAPDPALALRRLIISGALGLALSSFQSERWKKGVSAA